MVMFKTRFLLKKSMPSPPPPELHVAPNSNPVFLIEEKFPSRISSDLELITRRPPSWMVGEEPDDEPKFRTAKLKHTRVHFDIFLLSIQRKNKEDGYDLIKETSNINRSQFNWNQQDSIKSMMKRSVRRERMNSSVDWEEMN